MASWVNNDSGKNVFQWTGSPIEHKAPSRKRAESQGTSPGSFVIFGIVAEGGRRQPEDILAPILPHTPVPVHRAQKLHEYLGYDGQLFGTPHVVEYQEATRSHRALAYDHSGAIGAWAPSQLPPGQAPRQPAPLFKKLDESVIDEEYARLEA